MSRSEFRLAPYVFNYPLVLSENGRLIGPTLMSYSHLYKFKKCEHEFIVSSRLRLNYINITLNKIVNFIKVTNVTT